MSQHITIPQSQRPFLHALARFCTARGVGAWLVGGAVRDLLLRRSGYDLDVAVDGPALDLAREFADQTGGAFVLLDQPTETARVVWPAAAPLDPTATTPHSIDLVRLRAPTLDADLRLRDFSINALALPLVEQNAWDVADLIDPTGGRADLQARVLRPCGPTSITDDPLRMLRAVRFAAQLDGSLASETDAALHQHADLIGSVAMERVRDEMLKLLGARRAAPWLLYLDNVRLLTRIMPELEPARDCAQPREHVFPVLRHMLETVAAAEWLHDQIAAQASGSDAPRLIGRALEQPAALERWPDLEAPLPFADRLLARLVENVGGGVRRLALWKLAALLHDIGKPATKQITSAGRITFHDHPEVGARLAEQALRRLRISRDQIAYVQLIVREHMRPGQLRSLGTELTPRAVYRLLRDAGDAAPEVLLHSLCDHMAVRGALLSPTHWAQHCAWTGALLHMAWEGQRAVAPARLVTGDDLIGELGLAPGPLIGRILAAVAEAHWTGDVRTRAEALALARQMAHTAAEEA